MGKNQLIHSNEIHLIEKSEIHSAAKKMVEALHLRDFQGKCRQDHHHPRAGGKRQDNHQLKKI